jgi:hypothetical protein
MTTASDGAEVVQSRSEEVIRAFEPQRLVHARLRTVSNNGSCTNQDQIVARKIKRSRPR